MTELNARIRDIELPERMRSLPVSSEGYPVPWFVAWIDGQPDFRVIGPGKVVDAINHKKCWLCGDRLGTRVAFVIGPMCMVNRVSSEPPSHRTCAEYAVRACPFLTQPRMRRNTVDMPEEGVKPGGLMIERNPGVTIIWVTRDYRWFRSGGVLFRVGDPEDVVCYSHGRLATRDEVLRSMESGLPLLRQAAALEGAAADNALTKEYDKALRFVPAA